MNGTADDIKAAMSGKTAMSGGHRTGTSMLRYVVGAAIMLAVVPGTSALAVSSKDKMKICTFGADDQKLKGAARKTFITKCMSNKNDPRGKPVARPPAGSQQ